MTSRWCACLWAAAWCLAAAAQTASAQTPPPPAVQLTLPEALQRALQCHPDVRSALASIRQAEAQARIQRARLYPQLNLEYGINETQSLGRAVNIGGGVISSSGGRRTQRDAAITLDFNILESGRREEIRRAEVLAEAQRYTLPDAQRLLAFEVRQTYAAILANKQLARALLQSVAAAERHREIVQARITEGVAPRSDLLPVEVEVSQARLQAVQAEIGLETSEAALRALLQLPVETPLSLAEMPPVQLPTGTAKELLPVATRQRPDVQQQQLNVRAAELATRVAEIDRGIRLNATATADWGRHTDVTGEAWQLGFGASYPLFDAGATKAAVTSARAAEEIARERLAGLLLQVQEEVQAALLQLRQSAAVVESATVARRNAEQNLAAAELRYREGLAIIIEVTDAQVELLQAQVAEITARLDQQTALAALEQALGGPCPAPAAPAG